MELVPFELANEYELLGTGNRIGRFEIGDTLLAWCGTEQVPFYSALTHQYLRRVYPSLSRVIRHFQRSNRHRTGTEPAPTFHRKRPEPAPGPNRR